MPFALADPSKVASIMTSTLEEELDALIVCCAALEEAHTALLLKEAQHGLHELPWDILQLCAPHLHHVTMTISTI